MKKNTHIKNLYAVALSLATASTVGLPAAAQAAPLLAFSNSVVLSSEALIERTETDASGNARQVLKKPVDVIVVPGDKVIFTLRYANKGAEPATGFRATNPMPGPVQFMAVTEDWAEVSVDGGKSWGKLADLRVKAKAADGTTDIVRSATPEDVTHVRWVFSNVIAPGAEGSVSYRGLIK